MFLHAFNDFLLLTGQEYWRWLYLTTSAFLIWPTFQTFQKSGVRVVVDYADTRISNFSIQHLRENKTYRETVFECLYGA